MTRTIALLLTGSAFLSGCVTTPERPSEIPVAATSDKHARFEQMRVSREASDLLLTDWIRASAGIRNNFYKPGTIHIEVVGKDGVATFVDVPWRPNRVGRVRRLMPKRISVKLPLQASEPLSFGFRTAIRSHSDTSGVAQ